MPFVEKKEINGLIWVPEKTSATDKKHDCPDCEHCNHCADQRCQVCLRGQTCKKKRS